MSKQLSVEDVEHWLFEYLDALRSNDPERVKLCFSENVSGTYQIFRPSLSGREAIRKYWIGFFEFAESLKPQFEVWGIKHDEAIAMIRGEYYWRPSNSAVDFSSVIRLRFEDSPDSGQLCSFFESWHTMDDS